MNLSQFTPYTCILDCFASYLRELGMNVFTSDILTHHRDLCLGNIPPNVYEQFGVLDSTFFQMLVKRYLLVADELPIDDIANVTAAIADGHGIFVFCYRFDSTDNLKHGVRVMGVNGNEYEISSPNFFGGKRKLASPNVIKIDWLGPTCIRVKTRA